MKQRSSAKKTKKKLSPEQLVEVAEIFALLADPTRLAILQRLNHSAATVSELVNELGFKQANTSKQLGVLRQAGLVYRERNANTARYSLKSTMLTGLCEAVCGHILAQAETKIKRFYG